MNILKNDAQFPWNLKKNYSKISVLLNKAVARRLEKISTLNSRTRVLKNVSMKKSLKSFVNENVKKKKNEKKKRKTFFF